MKKRPLLLALCVLLALKLSAQPNQELDSAKITQFLYQHSDDDSPGMAVGVVQDGRIIYEHYLGYANLEHKVKVDQNTRFNIASCAKQFTALCVLQLIQQGEVKLEDDLRKYLPSMYPDVQEKITIAHLLTHTSGVRDMNTLWGLKGKSWWKMFIDNDDAIELLKGQKDLNFKPGTAYLYSNANYILLTEIVKKVSDQDFSEFAAKMFAELDMPSTSFRTDYMAIIPNKARPYRNWNGWREDPSITEVHGDGGLFTTLKDQLQWEKILQDNDGKYFTQELINNSQSPLAASTANDQGYGLMFAATQKGVKYRYHDGSTGAYNATFLRLPAKKMAVVVITNNIRVPTNYLAWQIATLTLDEDDNLYPGDPKKVVELNSIQDLLGNYENDGGTMIKITEKDGSIYREMSGRDPVKLINEKGALFEYETIKDLKMNFINIGHPKQQFTIYLSSQPPSTYYKLPNADLNQNNFDKEALNGRFYNDETDTEIILKYVEGNTYTLTKNGREREAELILEDYLRMNAYKINIVRDKENNVTGLNVENGRIRNVIFDRM